MQGKTWVTAHLKSKQLLLFAFAPQNILELASKNVHFWLVAWCIYIFYKGVTMIKVSSFLLQWIAAPQWQEAKAIDQLYVTQQTRDIHPMLVQCWYTVYDVDPTLSQLWVNNLCLLGHYMYMAIIILKFQSNVRDNFIMLCCIFCLLIKSKILRYFRYILISLFLSLYFPTLL